MVALILLVGCPAPAPEEPTVAERLASADVGERWAGFVSLDRDAMVANLDALIAMAQGERDERLRAEVVRQLGYTRDPRVLPVLEGIAGDPEVGWYPAPGWQLKYAVLESYAYYAGVEGCPRFAALLMEMPSDESGYPLDSTWFNGVETRVKHCYWALEPYESSHAHAARLLDWSRRSCCTARP